MPVSAITTASLSPKSPVAEEATPRSASPKDQLVAWDVGSALLARTGKAQLDRHSLTVPRVGCTQDVGREEVEVLAQVDVAIAHVPRS